MSIEVDVFLTEGSEFLTTIKVLAGLEGRLNIFALTGKTREFIAALRAAADALEQQLESAQGGRSA